MVEKNTPSPSISQELIGTSARSIRIWRGRSSSKRLAECVSYDNRRDRDHARRAGGHSDVHRRDSPPRPKMTEFDVIILVLAAVVLALLLLGLISNCTQ